MEIDNSIAHSGNHSLAVIGINATGTPSHSKVRYIALPAEKGKTYTIAFWAKVYAGEGQSRLVEANASMQGKSYSKEILLDSTEWKEYTYTFSLDTDEDGLIGVGLFVAQSDVDFWIDDFRFFEGTPPDEIKPGQTTVKSAARLPVSWGKIRRGY